MAANSKLYIPRLKHRFDLIQSTWHRVPHKNILSVEAFRWLDDKCIDKWTTLRFIIEFVSIEDYIDLSVWFKNKDDATLFTLTWI